MYKFKKISIIATVLVSGVLLFSGCGNKIKEQMDLAIKYLNSGKYNEAKSELDGILKEDSSNSEAKLLENIISDFESSKKLYDDGKFNKANDEIAKIPKEYSNYNIKNDVEKLKESISEKMNEIKEVDNKINDINKLINNGKLDEAKKELDELKNKNLTTDESNKIKDLENDLNKKVDEKNKEEKILKEKKQKELEQKKKVEENSKKVTDKQTITKKKEINTNKNSKNNKNTNENKSKPYVYVNKELGLQMTIPANWKGLYTIKSDDKGIYLSVKHIKSNPNLRQGFLFAVTKRSKMDDESIMDSVGRKRYVESNGVTYIIWGGTGVTMGDDNPDWGIYLRLSREKYSVAETVKAID
ncbi:hypothetical protein [Cetobacterium sp.]|uniref:hypothetical protein n=2 Tax=Cetobacterium sp. TaxID=2071632 RepID=UPI002FCC3B2E